ncbi:MAG: nitroreductase family protein [Firmicutes bacterium]|nr:nitroreductase family protein [Candidatus Fiminaster equi]
MSNKVIETIKSRVSCREYSAKKVSIKKLEMILEAGKSAPSACNRQIADITAVRKSSNILKIRELSKCLMNRDVMYGASTIVLVHAPREDAFCAQDCSCIIENMMIAATALKIDSCWINQFDELLNANEAKSLEDH